MARDPQKRQASAAAYRARHPERVKASAKNFSERNPNYNKECRTKSAEYYSNWRKENREICRTISRNRKARVKNADGKLSKDIVFKLLALQKGKCPVCKANLRKTGYHLDHIVPLSKGGKNDDKNVQLTCPTCNLKKGNKDPIHFMREMGYLL